MGVRAGHRDGDTPCHYPCLSYSDSWARPSLPTSGTTSTLTFTNFVHNLTPAVLWDVMIDDATANLFTVKVRVAPTSTVIGDILGIGFNVAPTYKALLTASDIAGTQVTGIFQNTRSCGQGCNFNGVIPNTFDRIVRIGHQGTDGGLITASTFTIATHGQMLDASTFTMVGIRAQAVGPRPTGGRQGEGHLVDAGVDRRSPRTQ